MIKTMWAVGMLTSAEGQSTPFRQKDMEQWLLHLRLGKFHPLAVRLEADVSLPHPQIYKI